MKIFRAALLSLLALATLARADGRWADAEHLFYVRIETDPPGATMLNLPAKEGAEATVIGRTPFVIPIEMNWDRSYLKKSWARLRIATHGNIATNEYDRDSKEQTVLLNFAIEKPGCTRQVVRQIAGVFHYDENAEDWEHAISELPEKRTLHIALAAEPTAPATANAAHAKPPDVPTTLVAIGNIADTDSLGYALIESPEVSPVFCDGIRAGKTPLRLMLPAGEHEIHTLQNGKPTPAQTIKIIAGKTETVTLPTQTK